MNANVPFMITCPQCEETTCVPDPSIPWGIRRVDTAGSVRIDDDDGAMRIFCCHCGHDWMLGILTQQAFAALMK